VCLCRASALLLCLPKQKEEGFNIMDANILKNDQLLNMLMDLRALAKKDGRTFQMMKVLEDREYAKETIARLMDSDNEQIVKMAVQAIKMLGLVSLPQEQPTPALTVVKNDTPRAEVSLMPQTSHDPAYEAAIAQFNNKYRGGAR
jgi:hypothetical protein